MSHSFYKSLPDVAEEEEEERPMVRMATCVEHTSGLNCRKKSSPPPSFCEFLKVAGNLMEVIDMIV